MQGIKDSIFGIRHDGKQVGGVMKQRAKAWINSKDFEDVCYLAGFDNYAFVRRQVRKLQSGLAAYGLGEDNYRTVLRRFERAENLIEAA